MPVQHWVTENIPAHFDPVPLNINVTKSHSNTAPLILIFYVFFSSLSPSS